jgi:Ca2+-binding EF-hand superfamily protein
VSHKVLLAHKMKTEVESNRNSSVLKELLAEELGSNFYQAFRQTDTKRTGYLNVDDMARIMGKFSITLTEAELDCLLRKYDSNRDGRVSYLEFLTQLMPEGRVDSLKTPYSSPARARIGYSPSKSLNASRSSPRDSSRQQLSFDGVDDEEDNQLVPFNQSFNNLSVNDRSMRTPTKSPNRSLAQSRSSPSRAALAVLSPERCIVANCHLPKYGRHYCSLHSNVSSPARNPAPSVAAEVSVEIKRELETDFESMRQRLALHPSYTLLNAFKHLDSTGNGYISIQQLRRCLTDAGYYVTPEELELCVKLFDSNGDGRISYSEFISKMMPTEAVYSELVSSPSAGGIRQERRLSIPAQLDLAKALKQRIDQEKQVDQLNRTQMYSWD